MTRKCESKDELNSVVADDYDHEFGFYFLLDFKFRSYLQKAIHHDNEKFHVFPLYISTSLQLMCSNIQANNQ